MLPTDLSRFSVLNIEEGFNKLKSENDKRMVPLRQLMREGKSISEADEKFLDGAGNMIEELLVLEKIKGAGSVTAAAKTLNEQELKSLELLILKSEQQKIVDLSAAKARKGFFILIQTKTLIFQF